MPTSKTRRNKTNACAISTIRRGDEDVLSAEDFWHGLGDLTYTEWASPAAHSEK